MAVKFEITEDNSDKILEELKDRTQAALEAIGNQAVSHAKKNITQAGRVDTGAMRNSMTHQVEGDTCYVGTNNEYAIYHEFGTGVYAEGGKGRQTGWFYVDKKGKGHYTRGMRPIHFLKNAIMNNVKEYQEIIKKYLSK